MIVNFDTHPEKQLYYVGALVLEILEELEEQSTPLLSLFVETKKRHNLSVNLVTLSLDWLFLLGAITFSNGEVRKCF